MKKAVKRIRRNYAEFLTATFICDGVAFFNVVFIKTILGIQRNEYVEKKT